MKRLWIALLIFGLLGLTYPLQKWLRDHRRSLAKSPTPPLRPGEFVGTLLLGSLRALAVDLLWVRAEKLRVEGKFFEELALLELLSELQPHLPMVWDANGYNLAYNVSLTFKDQKKQWEWMRKGILFLQRGLQKNPENGYLEKSLAFLYWHRLNQTSRGRYVRNPYMDTYFRREFLKDTELNPQGNHPYYHALYWSERAIKHLAEEDPIGDSIFIDSVYWVYSMEKRKGAKDEDLISLLKRGLDREKRIIKTNPLLHKSLVQKFDYLRRERALLKRQKAK